jgi:hypothetical protein
MRSPEFAAVLSTALTLTSCHQADQKESQNLTDAGASDSHTSAKAPSSIVSAQKPTDCFNFNMPLIEEKCAKVEPNFADDQFSKEKSELRDQIDAIDSCLFYIAGGEPWLRMARCKDQYETSPHQIPKVLRNNIIPDLVMAQADIHRALIEQRRRIADLCLDVSSTSLATGAAKVGKDVHVVYQALGSQVPETK